MKNSSLSNFFLILSLIFLSDFYAVAQESDKLSQFDASVIAGYAGPKAVPFWLRSNQYGSIPVKGASVSVLLRADKRYDFNKNRVEEGFRNAVWDWGYAAEARANLGSSTNVQLIDAHVKGRYGLLEAKLGRTKDVMGLNGDTLLSSGNFAVSGNALGIPVLDLRIVDYYRLPIFGGLISLKGNFANGYMGKTIVDPFQFNPSIAVEMIPTLYHQKSLYGRIGKKSWRLNLYGGINHQAQYGGERKVYGDVFGLNKIETIWYVIWGKAYGGNGVPRSKLGNQQGSIDVGLTYDWDNIQLMGYRQNFYDVGAISKLANIKDGLNGITLINKNFGNNKKKWDWHKLLIEFFYSKDQAGYPWSKRTKSGDEDYYNNYYYEEGWSYKGLGIGTPLIVTATSAKVGQAHAPNDFFISNRVVAGHLGFRGKLDHWFFTTKITGARHYGTFTTSEFGKSTGSIFHPPHKDRFIPVTQFSGYLQAEKLLKNNLYVGITAAADYGKLFHNTLALQFSVRKSFAY